MCVIGYDDYKEGGSFQIMNSWGEDWGKKGVCWVRYTDFKEFNVESYGLYPMGNADDVEYDHFEGDFGLVLKDGSTRINLSRKGRNYFESKRTVKAGEKFKVSFTNNDECYTYVFGEENADSSYVLFPYTAKHSPFCGITGNRVFPRDYSMQPDDVGSKDKIAILITKEPIDYNEVNRRIQTASGYDYETKVNNALGSFIAKDVEFSGNGEIEFKCDADHGRGVAFVIGIKK